MKKPVVSYPPMPPWVHGTVAVLAAVLIAASLGGCSKKNPTAMLAPNGSGVLASETAFPTPGGALHLEGSIGPGTTWVIDKPADWNGELVVWLQGYNLPQLDPALPNNGPIRDAILARGYAVTASSYSSTGWAVKDAVAQAHQLRGVFASRVGQPARTYLAGSSLGGLVAALMLEQHPDQYVGALLISGVEGGMKAEVDYLGDVRVLFDACYPGIMPGTVCETPDGVDMAQVLSLAKQAMDNDPIALHVIDALSRVEPQHFNGLQLEQTILTALQFQMLAANDIRSRTHGHVFYDNHDWTYRGGLPVALEAYINTNVARYTATDDAIAYAQHYGQPTGMLTRPVVTIHNNWDPLVPESNLDCYYACVNGCACCDHLLQHRVMRYGHGAFTVPEVMEAFEDLTAWVDTGVKPAEE